MSDSETSWILLHQASLSSTFSWSLLKFMSLSWWCYLTISPSSTCFSFAFNLPSIRAFYNEFSLCIGWPKYWSFNFNISFSNYYSGLISCGIDWFDLVAVQRTLKSLLQHHSSKASILRHSAFFIVQLSHPYMTTGKTIALTRRTFGQICCSHASVYSPYCSWLCLKNWKCWSAHSLHESSRKSYHLESCEMAPSQVQRTLAKAHAN